MPTTTALIRRRQVRQLHAQQGHQRSLRTVAGFALALAAALLLIIIAIGGVLAGIYAYYTSDLPSADALQAALSPRNGDFFQTTQIYDRTGQHLLYEVIDPRGGDRQYIYYNALPSEVISATVAIEDKTFFTNPGYDLIGIARALVSNLSGQAVQGGSSITQQLVKNTLIPLEQRAERSYSRKIREILMAAEITRRYSKEQILEWYLNTNFYGNLAYGIDAAALVYFGKHAERLSLAEAALLAAIPQSPGVNPIDALEDAQQRQRVVLDVMEQERFISATAAQTAREAELVFPQAQRFDIRAPHFSVYARAQAVKLLNQQGLAGEELVNRGGLKIFTTLDLDLQMQAECVVRAQVQRLSGGDLTTASPDCAASAYLPPLNANDLGVDHHVTNAALVALRPQTGEIIALVGSLDYWNQIISGNFNIALDGLRQPGSSFKPFTYLEAFRVGYSPASMTFDTRAEFPLANGEAYSPENYDRQFHGPVSMRVALARSYNLPAVQTINLVGVDNVVRLAHRLGINSLELGQYGLALTLGGGEVTLLDETYAYSVFANEGIMAGQTALNTRPGYRTLDPVSILRIDDRNGQRLYEFPAPQTQAVLSPELAYLINNVLSDSEARHAAFGRGNPLELADRPAAAKTGTTNDFRDNWTVGYVPQLAVGVWVGNADNTPMKGVTGLTGAAPIWHAVMSYATQDRALPVEQWNPPTGVMTVKVCEPSGLLPTRECQRKRDEVFITGHEPTTLDNIWQVVKLNRESGKRATVCTPPELVEERVFEILPPEAAEWVKDTNLPQPPTEYDPIGGICLATGNAVIAYPTPFSYIRGIVEITGTSKGDNYAFFRVEYGPGLFPQTWTQVEGDRGEQIENGLLQTWNTDGLDGLYSLRLVVVKNDPEGGPFTFDVATIQVTVDNQPPTIRLLSPTPNQEFTAGPNTAVVIQPQAQDNLSIARVEIYVNDALADTARLAPYVIRWKPPAAGVYTIFARVYDAAGNVAESERVVTRVK